jgi:beta-galactosidase
MELSDANRLRIRFWSDRLFEASASHVTSHDLFGWTNARDVVFRPEIVINLDYKQRGLGTASCGPDTLSKYRVRPGKIAFNFALQPHF